MAHGPTGSLVGAEPKPTHQTIHLVENYSISARTLLHNAVSAVGFFLFCFFLNILAGVLIGIILACVVYDAAI